MSATLILKVCNNLRFARRHFAIMKVPTPQSLERAYDAALCILYLIDESQDTKVDLRLLLRVLRRNVDESSLKIAAGIHRGYRKLDIHPDLLAHEALRSAASTLISIQERSLNAPVN